MKKWWIFLLLAALLSGCGAQPTFETVDDDDSVMASASLRQIELTLPKEAAMPTARTETGDSLYLCDGYTLELQTLSGGDLDRTLKQITGYGKDQLQLICTKIPDADRYDLTWLAAGEGGDQIARAVILDDGRNHYVVSVMAEAAKSAELRQTWQTLMNSVRLSTD